jgi:lysophospholipase L1-like esterase
VAFSVKAWLDRFGSGGSFDQPTDTGATPDTPVDAAGLRDMETRLSGYTDSRETAEISARNTAIGSHATTEASARTSAIAAAITAQGDLATQVELDAHVNDTTAAHAASAIAVSPAVGGDATVQAVLTTHETRLDAAQSGSTADVLRLPGMPRFMSLATRCVPNTQPGGAVGSTTGELLVWSHLLVDGGDNWRLKFLNTYGGGRVAAENSIFLRAALEDVNGFPHQLTFDGESEAEIVAEGVAVSDPIPLLLRAGWRVRSRTWVRVETDGDLVPVGVGFSDHYAEGRIADVGASAILDDAPTLATPGGFYFTPAVLGADYSPATASVFLYGDSITAGQGDANTDHDQQGWALRGLAGLVPYVMGAIPGDSVYAFTAPPSGAPNAVNDRRQRMQLTEGCTHALGMYGTNDLTTTGVTAVSIKRSLLRLWRALDMRGMFVIAATITPRTSSTDNWTTLVNQTVGANESVRVAINDWIRDGAPFSVDGSGEEAPAAIGSTATGVVRFGETGHPADKYYELADTVESSRNSGKWVVVAGQDMTDGVHPGPYGHPRMAEAVDLRDFGLSYARPGIDSAPVNTTAPHITGSAVQGATLTCSTGTWTDFPTSYTYQWRNAGVAISGATSSTYVIQAGDLGDALDCVVTGTNGIGTGTPTASDNSITPAAPTAPGQPTGLALTPGDSQIAASWTAPASNGGSAITTYLVEFRQPAGAGSYTTFVHSASTTPSITITGLTNGTTCGVRVSAVNAIGTGSPTAEGTATPAASFDPASLTPVFWHEPGAFAAAADSDPAPSYADASGNGRPLVQTTAGSRPLIRKGLGPNGSDELRFDGVNDYMTLAYSLVQPGEIWQILKMRSGVTSDYQMLWGRVGGGSFESLGWASLSDVRVLILNAGNGIDSGTDVELSDGYHVVRTVLNGASSRVEVDGVQVIAGDAGTNAIPSFELGARTEGYFATLNTPEDIAFNYLLSTGQAANMLAHWNTKFAL